MSLSKIIDIIDDVIRFLGNHKEQVINRLFSSATEGYKDEWRARDLFTFWTHLDSHNQRQLVKMAVEYYETNQAIGSN